MFAAVHLHCHTRERHQWACCDCDRQLSQCNHDWADPRRQGKPSVLIVCCTTALQHSELGAWACMCVGGLTNTPPHCHCWISVVAALLQYTVSVVGTLPSGQASPAANTLPMVMPAFRCGGGVISILRFEQLHDFGPTIALAQSASACSSPSLSANPTSPTTADITITPPPTGGPWASYKVKLCPAGGSTCTDVTCSNPNNCTAAGLTPSTTYSATASH